MSNKLTLEDVDTFVDDAVRMGKLTNRLRQDFAITLEAEERLKDLIRSKIEDPDFDDGSILASTTGFLIGYSQGLADMAEFVEKVYNK